MKKLFAALAALTAASSVLAEEQYTQEIIVSATKTEQILSEVLASASVISRADLERIQPVDLIDVFASEPGVDLIRSGGRGATASIQLRGSNSDHALILVNGQRINSATLGGTQFQLLDPEQIERIEIVRGSRSALYGSDAIGGVIQLFTRSGGEELSSYIKAEVGSNALWKVAAGTSGTVAGLRYGFGGSYLETDGIDNRVDDSGYNGDKDGYENDTFNASFGYTLENGVDLELNYFQTNSTNEHDSQYSATTEQPYSENTISILNGTVIVPLTEYWQTSLMLGQSMDDSDNFDDITDTKTSHFRTSRDSVYFQNDFTLAEGHLLTLGYDYYDEKIDTSSDHEDVNGNPVDSRHNEAFYAQYQASVGSFDAIFGLREDDNEAFGAKTTGSVSLGYQLDGNHKVVLSWAEGFKAPTFNDLYWPVTPWSAGNPDVLPEESENYEVSFRGLYDAWNWSFAYFKNTIDNLIDWAPGTDFVWRPSNVKSAEIKGGELVTEFATDEWRVAVLLSYTDALDASTGSALQNRAKKKAVLDISRSVQQLVLGITAKAQSERATNSTEELDGYGIVGVYAAMDINEHLKVRLKLNNLFDVDYQLNDGFNEDGLDGLLSVTYSF